MKLKIFSIILSLTLVFQSAFAELVPIRGSQISQCQILLAQVVEGKKSDAMAKRISSKITPEDLRENLRISINQEGREAIKGSDVYVTGVEIREENKFISEYKKVLSEKEFSDLNLELKVISVPKKLQKKLIDLTLKDIWEKVIYFMPSTTRDYQRPTFGEVFSGLGLTVLVEIPTVVGLFKTLPALDAAVTSMVHASLLTALTIYQRAFANWMMRSQTQAESFLKQLFVGGMFVTNYYLFGNLTPALEFMGSHNLNQIGHAALAASVGFLVSQGVTTAIQTEFYSKFIQGIRGKWVEIQKNEKTNNLAREAGNWVMFFPQMANAFVLSQASIGRDVFFSMGPVEFNYWQLGLLGFWASAYGVYKNPEVLNPFLPHYEKMHSWIEALRSKFKKEVKDNID